MQNELIRGLILREHMEKYIYIACPWTPKGGGMFKVADYLIQAQDRDAINAATLRPLDTRGGSNALYSFFILITALTKLIRGRYTGQLAGVHVNMAERLSLFRKSAVVVFCKMLGIPVVLHLHAAQLPAFYRKLPLPLKSLTRWVFSLPATCLVLGEESHRFVTEELLVPENRVQVIINGVPEPINTRRKPDNSRVKRVLFLGNLSERKGVSDLLKALALPGFDISRLEVTLAGGGNILAYEATALKLGINGFVRFTGWSNQHQVSELMSHADLLVLPSYDEGLPLVILEALANSVVVVCTPVGEIPSVLTDGLNACFVQPGDVQGIACALQCVLNNHEFMLELEKNGRRLYEEKFSVNQFFDSVAKVHQRHFGIAGQVRLDNTAHHKEVS
ncbi:MULTISPECIES: glycosyltransferase family 4 protein [unclassified Polaromonas]|uniref:glycosyltransferase family 4 protein n=1 Tax=unclassified Polaromonas TaxID=2638319 RepID=UPI0018CB1E95|nr:MULTISPECIES: glycosyltransferase family 4 protein [unclassified Polaromonas]MBG6072392.1 glycosyltransferase involved in cell wall biosynthesis [Polaromonas sp. CG_9.7]MBG6114396.1 glycosyltransferase involved in cell wall biosynthesis [Polaromonas sp. CG_9.2]